MDNSTYITTGNTGLPSDFVVENGRFRLVGGEEKVRDSLHMLLFFVSWFRLLVPDFVTDVLWLLQQPSDKARQFKNVFRLQLLRAAEKHCPFAEVRTLDFSMYPGERKHLTADVEFRHVLEKKSNFKQVKFLVA